MKKKIAWMTTVIVSAGLMLGSTIPPESTETTAPAPAVAENDTLSGDDALAVVVNLPIRRVLAVDLGECDRILIDEQILLRHLNVGACGEVADRENLQGVALAAIQGLYEQIQARDEILLQLDERNRELAGRIDRMESERREEREELTRLETRLNDALNNLERQVGSTSVAGTSQQNSQLAQRISNVESERRSEQSRLSRIESRLDSVTSRVDRQSSDMQSRLSRIESRVMSMTRN